MFGLLALVPIVFVIIIFALLTKRNAPPRKIITVTRKFHLVVLTSFIGILIVMTILVELIYPSSGESNLSEMKIRSEEAIVAEYNAVEQSILAGQQPDSSLLVASRTHESSDQLTIDFHHFDYPYPTIYIERRDGTNNMIEEHIYKPFLIVNDYDFTSQVDIQLPVWTDDVVTIPDMVQTDIKIVEYKNNTIFNQFTSAPGMRHNSDGFGSSGGAPFIHLIVPQEIDIIDPYDVVVYVNE